MPSWALLSGSASQNFQPGGNSNIVFISHGRGEQMCTTGMKLFQILSESSVPKVVHRHFSEFLENGNTYWEAFISEVCWPSSDLLSASLSWPTNTVQSQDEGRSWTVIRDRRGRTIDCMWFQKRIVHSEEDENEVGNWEIPLLRIIQKPFAEIELQKGLEKESFPTCPISESQNRPLYTTSPYIISNFTAQTVVSEKSSS